MLRSLQNLLEKALAVDVGSQLEVVTSLITCKCEQYDPLAVVFKEWCYGVGTHIWRYCQRVNVVLLEEGLCVHLRRISYVATFRISDDEVVGVVLLEIAYGAFETHHSLQSVCFVECEVRFVRHAVGCCGVDDSFVKREDRVFLLQQMLRNLLYVGV